MLKSNYTRFLEGEVQALRERVEALEKRNQELVLAVVNRTPLREQGSQVAHKMQKGTNMANCSCGWKCMNDDPAKLQDEISKHYRSYAAQGGRSGWPEARRKLEETHEPAGSSNIQ